MDVTKLGLMEFVSLISSKDGDLVGGSVLSFNGAISSSLLQMAVSITKASKKEKDGVLDEVLKDIKIIEGEFFKLCAEDAAAFKQMLFSLKMPKTTEKEKKDRNEQMQKSLILCAKPSLEIMKVAFDCIKNIEKVLNKTNKLLITDLGIVVLNLKAVVGGAYLNVLTNIKHIEDKGFCDSYKKNADFILVNSNSICDIMHKHILENI